MHQENATQLLKSLWDGLVKLSAAIRVIMPSRPEPQLLASHQFEPIKSQLEMDLLDTEVLRQKRDIWKHYREDNRELLVELSQGRRLHATTVARVLAESIRHDSEKQLEAVFSSHREIDGECGHNTHLRSVYSTILAWACLPISPSSLATPFRDVFETVLIVQVPVNIHTLVSLLCPDKSKLREYTRRIRTTILAYLQAILIVPGVEEGDPSRDAPPIRFIHKSFENHLTDKSRCDPRFLLNITQLRQGMSARCLVYSGLVRNICSLDSSNLYSEVADLQSRIQNHVPAGRYACTQWSKDVPRLPTEEGKVDALLEKFAQTQPMHWVEAISLLE